MLEKQLAATIPESILPNTKPPSNPESQPLNAPLLFPLDAVAAETTKENAVKDIPSTGTPELVNANDDRIKEMPKQGLPPPLPIPSPVPDGTLQLEGADNCSKEENQGGRLPHTHSVGIPPSVLDRVDDRSKEKEKEGPLLSSFDIENDPLRLEEVNKSKETEEQGVPLVLPPLGAPPLAGSLLPEGMDDENKETENQVQHIRPTVAPASSATSLMPNLDDAPLHETREWDSLLTFNNSDLCLVLLQLSWCLGQLRLI